MKIGEFINKRRIALGLTLDDIGEAVGVGKKVTYGDDWILLHSFNPEYKDREFRGKDVQRIRVLGRVMKIIKEM